MNGKLSFIPQKINQEKVFLDYAKHSFIMIKKLHLFNAQER